MNFYARGWDVRGKRGESTSDQCGWPLLANDITTSCTLFWNSETDLALTTFRGSKLYTATSPSADLLSSGDLEEWRGSSNLDLQLGSLRKKSWNFWGPFPKTVLWIKPNMAISRRVDKGAKWKRTRAVTSSTPTSRKKMCCKRPGGEVQILCHGRWLGSRTQGSWANELCKIISNRIQNKNA